MNISYTITSSTEELKQIIVLQQHNLPTSISQEEKKKEGFVTVQHDLSILQKMNDKQPHIIAKDRDKVVGYALCMHRDFKDEIEILRPMFAQIEKYVNPSESYITMGQICVDKAYRKQGIFRGLYHKMQDELNGKYNVLITEVAANNTRSLHAHYAVGFTDLLVYESDGVKWHLIHWNWA